MKNVSEEDLVTIWLKGFFSGMETGIKSVATMLQNAEEHEAPCPPETRKYLVIFGRAIEKSATQWAQIKMDQMEPE
jgi:hypothetical protein